MSTADPPGILVVRSSKKVSERYFLNLQNDIDIRSIKSEIWEELDRIKMLRYA